MADSISKYKKSSTDYTKYRANNNANMTAVGGEYYGSVGQIDEVEDFDFGSEYGYGENFVGPLPDGALRNNEILQKFFQILSQNQSFNEFSPEKPISSEFIAFLDSMPTDEKGYFKGKINDKIITINVVALKDYCSQFGATFNELMANKLSYITSEDCAIEESIPKPPVSDNDKVTLIDNEIWTYKVMLAKTNKNFTDMESYGRLHYENGTVNMDVRSPDIGMIMLYDQMLSQPGKWTDKEIKEYRQKLDDIITKNSGGVYTSFDLWRSDLRAAKNSIDYINKAIDDLEKEKRIEICLAYTETDEFKKFVPEYPTIKYAYSPPRDEFDLSYVSENREYIDSLFYDGFVDSLGFDFNLDYKKLYYYIKETQGEDAAKSFKSDIQDSLNCFNGLIDAAKLCKTLDNESDVGKALEIHLNGIGFGWNSSFESIAAWFSKNPERTINNYQAVWTTMVVDSGRYGGKLQRVNLDVGQAVGNMMPSVALSYINPYLGAVYLGMSSGGNKYREARWQGYSVEQARLLGIVSGCSEVLTEKLLGGLPLLSGVEVTNLKTFLVSMICEGNQEVLQDLINSMLLGEEFTLEDAMYTFIIGALTSGEMTLPGLAFNKININSISKENGWLKIPTENGEIAIDLEQALRYLKEHPNSSIEDLSIALQIQSLETPQSNSTATYNLNYSNYVSLCNKLSITPETKTNFEKNSEAIYKNMFNNISSIQLSQIIPSCSVDEFSLLLNNMDYTTFQNVSETIIAKLNYLSNSVVDSDTSYVNDLTWIFANLNDAKNYDISNALISNVDSNYMKAFTKYLLNGSLDYYETAIDFANTELAAAFQTYRTHCEGHVVDVASKSIDSAKSIMATLQKFGYSGNVSLYEIYVAGIWHDVGMAAGDYGMNAINSNFNKKDKTCKPDKLVETVKSGGNITRSNHTLNSALAILNNASYFSDFLGIDASKLALTVFAHSKSNSGVANLTVASDWNVGIEVLDASWAKYNELFGTRNNDYVSFKEMCKRSGILDANGVLTLSALSELSTLGLSLRVGDANTTTINDVVTFNQANKVIKYVMSDNFGLDYATFSDRLANDPDGSKLAIQKLLCEEFGVEYKVGLNKKGEKEIQIIDNGEILQITAGDETVELSPLTIAFVVGENNIGFELSSVSPTGVSDGKIHEVCTIKDGSGDMLGPIIFNINERLGEIKSGISSASSGTMASIDIVFPVGTSSEILQCYDSARQNYFGDTTGIEFNYYIKDSNGKIVSFIRN